MNNNRTNFGYKNELNAINDKISSNLNQTNLIRQSRTAIPSPTKERIQY